MDRYLYRGVNSELYHAGKGLGPKSIGSPFKRVIRYGEGARSGAGLTYGESEPNAVIMHQKNSSKYPTSGVSTTPIFENAKLYATHNEKYDSGFVYKIDIELLEKNGVKAYAVSQYAVSPAIPGDKEVILVADHYGTLPNKIVVEIIKV